MIILILGLLIFFAIHMVPAFHETRSRMVDRLGEGGYKVVFSLISLIGLVMAAWGYSMTPPPPRHVVYYAPEFMGYVTIGASLIGFILIFANYGNGHIKRTLKDPFAVGIALWSFGHLLSNGDWASIILFGSFLLYALVDLMTDNERIPFKDFQPKVSGDVKAIILGGIVFGSVYFAHPYLFGVSVL